MGESPLFKHIARSTIQIIGGLGLGLLLVMLLVGWRLASGPVSIGFLTPYIDRALNDLHEGTFDVTFDDTILTWAGWERTLDIRIVNLRVMVPSGDLVADVPEVSISLSAEALINGTVAPRSVEFFGPSLQVSRLADGQVEMGFVGGGEGSDSFVTGLMMAMLQEPDPAHAISYLTRVSVVAGEVTFIDHALGTTWQAPRADASIERVASGLGAELDLDLLTGGDVAAVSVLGDYSVEGERIDLGVSFEGVNPATFADLTPDAAVLGALDLPLSGTVTLSVEQGGRVEGFGFDVNGRGGHVALPVGLAQRMGALAWAQRVRMEALHLAGRFDGARHALEITGLEIVPGRGETVHLAHPIDHQSRIERLETALSYHADTGELDIQRLHLDMGGPNVEATARLTDLRLGRTDQAEQPPRGLFADVDVTARNVPFDDLAALWPAGIGDEARDWVLGGLSAGVADHAEMQVSLRPDGDGGTRLAALAGRLSADNVDVDYLPPMKRVTNAKASATFNEQRFDIAIENGDGTRGLKVREGDIALYDLHTDVPKASIALDIAGPVTSALTLIDDEPLKFSSDLGIKPADANGDAEVRVNLTFPLLKDLAAADVVASAEARLTNAGLKGVVFGRDLTNATLDLKASNDELTVKGEGQLGGVPVDLSWVHDFRDGALFLDRYELSGHIENVLNLNKLGIQVPDVLARYLHGGAEANVSYTEFNDGRQALSAGVDLANISLNVPELGWAKPVGVPGNGTLDMRMIHDLPRAIPEFRLTAPDMTVAGAVKFTGQGKLARVDIAEMRTGLTDVAGSLTPGEGDVWELVLRGESLDARNLWNEFIGRTGEDDADQPEPDRPEEDPLALNVATDVRTVVMNQGRVVEDLIGTLYRRRGAWMKIDAIGIVGEGAPLEVLLDTDDAGLRYVSITSPNAGSALRRLDLYDNMLGGTLDLKAAYTTPDEDAPLEGVMKIDNFAMRDAPVFARLIGIMSLTGVLDALQGEGLNFDIAEVPFKLDDGVLELTQARASGPSLGVTTNGRVDMNNQVLNLKGTVVPAYAINALLGKIPLIGELFTGSEKGGGLFAATYTMRGQGENVDITVNPLSALAPGVLRNIFTGSDKAEEILEGVPPETR